MRKTRRELEHELALLQASYDSLIAELEGEDAMKLAPCKSTLCQACAHAVYAWHRGYQIRVGCDLATGCEHFVNIGQKVNPEPGVIRL